MLFIILTENFPMQNNLSFRPKIELGTLELNTFNPDRLI